MWVNGRRSGPRALLARSIAGMLTRHCSRVSLTISGCGHDRQRAVVFQLLYTRYMALLRQLAG
eukprot:8700316-Lingulodinium_polyedra.AAC.1